MLAAPVIPVVVINDPKKAVSLARALVKGGLPAIEVTLRTPRATECLKAIVGEVEGAIPGVGTVLNSAHITKVESAGALFMVSPGVAPDLLRAAENTPIPLLPGAATASEMMTLLEQGYSHMKFFPASAAGGASYLKALSSPLPQASICPTGGIGPDNAQTYLDLPNVLCVGGSWVAPNALVDAGEWDQIADLAKAAATLSVQ